VLFSVSNVQAINHTNLKNIVGTYYVPTAIMVNVSVFETLTQDNLRSGSGELTKNAVMFGGEHLSVLEPILRRHAGNLHYTEDEILALMRMGIKAKGMLLKDDPKERTTAIIFEYGHTVGHAVELTYGVSHGCAVALGMLAASYISEKLGIMTAEDRVAHDELVNLLDVWLPFAPTPELQASVFKRVAGDNKRGYLPLK
jgi:3-dehydroquinate synthase/2-deoxy-scyllo-inosose synthase